MAPRGKAARSTQACPPLSEQGHQQVVDYLRLAEKSAYPEIRRAALEIAKETSKYQRRQGARVSPTLILTLDLTLGVVVTAACWYAFLHYSERLAVEMTSISIGVYLVCVAISLFLSGHLSQANFMKVLSWLESRVKTRWNAVLGKFGNRQPQDDGRADGANSSPQK